MENKTTVKKAKLFNLKHFPMDLARFLCSAVPLFFRVKKIYVSGDSKQKLRGGAIIVANHTSFADPLILCCSFWYRRMFYLAAENVMTGKVKSAMLKGLGCIKIDRNICDIESIRKAVDTVKQGHVLTIFPQGGIKAEEDINAIKSGVILMAMQGKVPIVPCYLHHKSKKGDKTCVVIGEPLDLFGNAGISPLKDINKHAQTVLEKMAECKDIYEKSME